MDFYKTFFSRDALVRLVVPAVVLFVLVLMLLPLPPVLLDIFFTLNIGVSVAVLIAALNVRSFKDFISFPTILLITTLLRLSLNVASTRVVLVNGQTGTNAAGHVIEAFGNFLIGGNFTVGIVIFIVITIINFIVITKGSGRVAEVSARFALDSLPGKQMAIDADLNAGLIKQEEAKHRREEVAQEADFYGSMDGASKFVRGDAIAAILILAINLIGGLIVGVTTYDLTISKAFQLYGFLTIGDGLVAQIPALIISTAAGIMITRVATEKDFSGQTEDLIKKNKSAFFIASGMLAVLGVIPNMPHLSFLSFSALFAIFGFLVHKKNQNELVTNASIEKANLNHELSWTDVPNVEPLALELPHRLIALVNKGDDSDLVKRLKAIRKRFISDMGFLSPSVHIRDNLSLQAETYRFTIYGGEVGRGQCFPNKLLAIPPEAAPTLPGIQVKDPSFGLNASWIEANDRSKAIKDGHTIVEPAVVLATHLDTIMRKHAGELFGREECQELVEHAKKNYPKLVEDTIPKLVTVSLLQRVMALLLDEGIPVKDIRSALETISDFNGKSNDPIEILPHVRQSIKRAIVQPALTPDSKLHALSLEPEFERLVEMAMGNQPVASAGMIEPGLMRLLNAEILQGSNILQEKNYPVVVLTGDRVRLTIARVAKRINHNIKVFSISELPSNVEVFFEKTLCSQAKS